MWLPAFVFLIGKISQNVKKNWMNFNYIHRECLGQRKRKKGKLSWSRFQKDFDLTKPRALIIKQCCTCITTACIYAMLVVCHNMWGNVLCGGLGSKGLFPSYFIISCAVFIVFTSQVTFDFTEEFFAVELHADTKMQKRRQRLVLFLLLGSAPCRVADIKSCIVLVCPYACPSVCVCVCLLIGLHSFIVLSCKCHVFTGYCLIKPWLKYLLANTDCRQQTVTIRWLLSN